eukprot:TRINITY_DN102466_c0_g1_i1.p1 TRINITY_DN102466_c0_g1~~TRINITY_DN102466_c0_g1_i1.p1  ORF type:complete len:239 (+),score=13.41 TRINITY_DN102466_c0_g1_i1:31-717(+)
MLLFTLIWSGQVRHHNDLQKWYIQVEALPTCPSVHRNIQWPSPWAGIRGIAGAAVCSSIRWRCRASLRCRKPRATCCNAQAASASLSSPSSSVLLNDGNTMPAIGLGTAMPPERTYEAVRSALDLGYRFVDTAQNYQNEEFVGKAVRDFLTTSGVERNSVFVSTKFSSLQPRERSFSAVLEAGRESCRALGVEYIDSILIHSPYGGKLVEAYDALLQLQAEEIGRAHV